MSASSIIEKTMQAMAESFRSERAGSLRVVYQFRLTGDGGGTWTISVADGRCSVSRGAPPHADTTIIMSTGQYLQLAAGELDAVGAFNRGQIKVGGNLAYARKFIEFFPPWAARTSPDTPVPSPVPTPTQPASTEPSLADYIRAMPKGFRPDRASGLRAIYYFQLSGVGGGAWSVTVANRSCTVVEGKVGSPSATISMSEADFVKLAQGKLDTTRAYSQGKIRISGDVNMAARIRDIFGPWSEFAATTPRPEPSPTPSPSGPVNPRLLNGSFDDYQPFVRDGEAKVWKESQYPERYGANWTLVVISEAESRIHLMDSGTFGRFTQKYFGGGGRDYHVHGRHSQVVTSRYGFDLVFMQTVAAQPGRQYTFSGNVVSFYRGTDNPATHGKVFKTLGIDPTGGRNHRSSSVVWGERDGRDHEWRHPVVRARAQAEAVTVFIRLENTEHDVGSTELTVFHLDEFELES